jgi:CxxC-x17-CxxC domain-containing protein
MEDKQITCRDCRHQFSFTVAEQEFFKNKGLTNEPKRCANCRILLRSQRSGLTENETAEVACCGCGGPTRVPFQPNGRKPVLCNVCFHNCRENKVVAEINGKLEEQELALA